MSSNKYHLKEIEGWKTLEKDIDDDVICTEYGDYLSEDIKERASYFTKKTISEIATACGRMRLRCMINKFPRCAGAIYSMEDYIDCLLADAIITHAMFECLEKYMVERAEEGVVFQDPKGYIKSILIPALKDNKFAFSDTSPRDARFEFMENVYSEAIKCVTKIENDLK